MTITFGSSNISSLQAQKSLSDATSKVADAYKELSSGLRINQASDDAAGLSIATALNSKARIYNVGVRNVNDGISASNIAEGALNALKNISDRQLELTEQAANGTYSAKQRTALNTEANALVDEYNRIAATTTFNGLNLFDPSLGTVLIQAGNSTLKEGFSDALARIVGNGTFGNGTSFSTSGAGASALGDLNGDGVPDVVSVNGASGAVSVLFGNGDGTFSASTSFASAAANPAAVSISDVNGDGKADLVIGDHFGTLSIFLNNGNGTFAAPLSFKGSPNSIYDLRVGDFNGDGRADVFSTDEIAQSVSITLGNGDGTFQVAQTIRTGVIRNEDLTIGDFNGDGKLDVTAVSAYSGTISVFLGNGNGTFQKYVSYSAGTLPAKVASSDINGDGISDLVMSDTIDGTLYFYKGNGDGTFASPITTATTGLNSLSLGDVNGDGRIDVVTSSSSGAYIFLSNGDGTFKSPTLRASSGGVSNVLLGDLNNDGVLDLLGTTPTSTISTFIGNTTKTSNSQYLNLNSRSAALSAQTTVNANLSRIEGQLGSLGAIGSRFQTALNNLQVQSQNFTAAASRIQDADIAQEAAMLVRTQVLQQAATAVLAQANQQPALALKLLGG